MSYLSLKFRANGNIQRQRALLWTVRATTFRLRSHKDHFAFFATLPQCSDQKINDISSTTWTKQNKKHLFVRKLSSLDPILYTYFFGPFNRSRRLLKGWHLFPFHPVAGPLIYHLLPSVWKTSYSINASIFVDVPYWPPYNTDKFISCIGPGPSQWFIHFGEVSTPVIQWLSY